MQAPKKKVSTSRRDMRRSHHALSPRRSATCAHCGAAKPSHRICPACGYYRGRQVIQPSVVEGEA